MKFENETHESFQEEQLVSDAIGIKILEEISMKTALLYLRTRMYDVCTYLLRLGLK